MMSIPRFAIPVVMFGAVVLAQTNAPTPTRESPPQIRAKEAEFQITNRVAIYRGDVHVEDERMKLWCDVLTVTFMKDGDRPEIITAEPDVIIDMVDENNQTIRATGEKLVYTYAIVEGRTNEQAVLTGNPRILRQDLTNSSDSIRYDLMTGKMYFSNALTTLQGTSRPLIDKPSPGTSQSTNK